MMKTLAEIFHEQGNTTDKLTAHQYISYYAELFAPIRKQVKSVLEIGIAQGGSIRAWEEYFPNAVIFGIDILDEFVKGTGGSRITTRKVDAGNALELTDFAGHYKFDIIIDDGSHKYRDIVESFYWLWGHVNAGGIYIVEDAGQTDDNALVHSYFAEVSATILLNYHFANEIIFRPNMIVLKKRQEHEPMGAL